MKKPNATRFPAARIKKLIQADEDVGKVASATPVVVSKALELFLGSLVAECVKDATARGSNKITAYGLKRTITSTELFDFCTDIVANVPDPISEEVGTGSAAGGGEPKKKRQRKKPTAPKMNDSDIEGDNPPPPKKRRAKAKVIKDEEEEEEEEEEEAEDTDEPKASGSGSAGKVKDGSDDYSDGGEDE